VIQYFFLRKEVANSQEIDSWNWKLRRS